MSVNFTTINNTIARYPFRDEFYNKSVGAEPMMFLNPNCSNDSLMSNSAKRYTF